MPPIKCQERFFIGPIMLGMLKDNSLLQYF